MRLFAFVFSLASIVLFYVTEINQNSEVIVHIKSWDGILPLPIWGILGILAVVCFGLDLNTFWM